MTLGGFSLATGILVDDATVVIENIERHVGMGNALEPSIVNGTGEILLPTFLSTLSICIVFIPVFLLKGTAHYLFSPLSMAVVMSLLASLILSRTLVPVMFKYLMRSTVEKHLNQHWQRKVKQHSPHSPRRTSWWSHPFAAIHYGFEKGFNSFRNVYRHVLAWAVAGPGAASLFFACLMVVSLMLFPFWESISFRRWMRGRCDCTFGRRRARGWKKLRRTLPRLKTAIRQIVGDEQIDVMLDNIGLPYSGINIALSDAATVGPMDGEILISLKEEHTPTRSNVADLRRELPKAFSGIAIFLPAGGHRESGAELRPARSDRHSRIRAA